MVLQERQFWSFGFAIMYILNQSKNIAAGIQLVFNILKPFLYGALIAYLLAPICNQMDERFLKWFPKATEKQKKEVIAHLSDRLKGKVHQVYRVINQKHKKRFNDYTEKRDIHQVKQLWHGSRNENWFSILENGLQLNPNAIITGKMFGKGIYFAPSSNKSWNYTSYRGTSWASGNSDTAFMGALCNCLWNTT